MELRNNHIMAIMINRVKCELYSITHFQYNKVNKDRFYGDF